MLSLEMFSQLTPYPRANFQHAASMPHAKQSPYRKKQPPRT
jgi:hypothetical protein